MSRHHRAAKHTTHASRLRPSIAAQLPLPCIHCGRAVTAEQAWDLGHLVALVEGGHTDINSVGPAHVTCNRSDGGRIGAAMVNRRRKSARGLREW
jgi:hypothetical protein